MKLVDGQVRLAATDLTTFAACPHATKQELAVREGRRAPPPYYPDPSLGLLRERGHAHEAAYVATLRSSQFTVEEMPDRSPTAGEATLEAMRRGVEVIYQGTLLLGARWFGKPDFLHRVNVPSSLGAWSYEPADAKLARSAKGNALLQLCFYSELLNYAQGAMPRRMTLVLGDGRAEHFTTARYTAYFRYVRARFEAALASSIETYPEPVAHCEVCDYSGECDNRRHADDHLSLVAGISGKQRRFLEPMGVRTVRQLAAVPLAKPLPVEGIGFAAFTRIREQARIQVEGRDAGALRYELLRDVEPGRGLEMLPEPSPGDLFLDFEGDPYVLGDGIEYLLGFVEPSIDGAEARYTGLWAFDRQNERAAFEQLMAFVTERRARHPAMHVYHYNHYEPTALKKLAGRYATCVDELDVLLRGKVFVDLYRVVKAGLRASVESYSIKRLERLFGFTRSTALRDANRCLAAFEAWMELRTTSTPHDELRDTIQGYNRDDCLSAWKLRDWLEERRTELEGQGVTVARPVLVGGEPTAALAEHLARVQSVARALLDGVPDDPAEQGPDEHARYVLAHLLEWHRREDKSDYWKYYDLCELTDEALQEDGTAIGGLTYEGIVGTEKKSNIHRYRYPAQDHALRCGRVVDDPRTKKAAGELVHIDDEACILDLKRGMRSAVLDPKGLIPCRPIENNVLRDSLLRLGEYVTTNGLIGAQPFAAALALLRRDPPLPASEGVGPEERLIAQTLAIQGSVLPVQGPPGTGKTHCGARMIVRLVEAHKRVGITANSHKVITNLLKETCDAARKAGETLRVLQKSDDEEGLADPFVRVVQDNAEVVRALDAGEVDVVAGTAWLWAREDMIRKVSVLFVDEAGQMSLANVLAAAPAANGIVLLGDPQQLDQPQKGVHPPGTSRSALGHVLGDRSTIDVEQGLFLEETWRMHPDVCRYISEVFYEDRLRSRADLSAQRLDAPDPLGGTGLRFVPVEHRGNRSESAEEVEVVARLIDGLLDRGATWTDRHGCANELHRRDVLVVAPYNAHVALLRKRLPGVSVGTVDKFQGQQAPVVIYTMATSSPEDAPRGMPFLYSGNRLNVAISRARCAAFLVANPSLFEASCKSVRDMALANAFCRYLEMARKVTLP